MWKLDTIIMLFDDSHFLSIVIICIPDLLRVHSQNKIHLCQLVYRIRMCKASFYTKSTAFDASVWAS